MNRHPINVIFTCIIFTSLLLPSCTSKRSDELLATIHAAQYGNPQEETQVALGITQTAVEALIQNASKQPPPTQPTIMPSAFPTATVPAPPTATSPPAAIQASQESITCAGFDFRIDRLGFDSTMQGLLPKDMGANSHILFVEFELLSGAKEAFEGLTIPISTGSGYSSEPIALISSGSIMLLATLTMTGEAGQYDPVARNITWAYVVPKNAAALYLNFPTGEVIDLSSLL